MSWRVRIGRSFAGTTAVDSSWAKAVLVAGIQKGSTSIPTSATRHTHAVKRFCFSMPINTDKDTNQFPTNGKRRKADSCTSALPGRLPGTGKTRYRYYTGPSYRNKSTPATNWLIACYTNHPRRGRLLTITDIRVNNNCHPSICMAGRHHQTTNDLLILQPLPAFDSGSNSPRRICPGRSRIASRMVPGTSTPVPYAGTGRPRE